MTAGANATASDGTGSRDDRPTVLAVDDQERVAEAFELWLGEEYEVLTATGGEEALDRIDAASPEVVLLDRHMPGMSGDEVLDRIREAGYDCRVAMVTAVDPDFDIVEMPFDEYVTKPLDGETLRDLVDRLLRVDGYEEGMLDLYGVVNKRATLEAEKHERELRDHEEYERLRERETALHDEMDEMLDDMDADEMERLFRNLD